MPYDKIFRFPSIKTSLFFMCGFMIGCFAPTYIWDFLKSINDSITGRLQGAISVYYGETAGGIKEGDPVIFFLIAMLGGILFFIKTIFTFIWGILFGYFFRTTIIFFGFDKSISFLGKFLGT